MLESLIGDAIGPGTWLDTLRQTVSTYAWDGWADLDPEEPGPADGVNPARHGAAWPACWTWRGQLGGKARARFGCGAGRTAFDLAERGGDTLVLGVDIRLALLRLARRAAAGALSYPRRRIGIVYDRRRFPVALPGAERVDFWACDALALPFAPDRRPCRGAQPAGLREQPRRLLAGLAEAAAARRPGAARDAI